MANLGRVPVEHRLRDPANEVLRRPKQGPDHQKMNADPQPGRHAIVRAVPGIAVKHDQRACRCFDRDRLVVAAFADHGLAADRVAVPLVTARYEGGATVVSVEIGQRIVHLHSNACVGSGDGNRVSVCNRNRAVLGPFMKEVSEDSTTS